MWAFLNEARDVVPWAARSFAALRVTMWAFLSAMGNPGSWATSLDAYWAWIPVTQTGCYIFPSTTSTV